MFSPANTIGDRYITQKEWDVEWERAPRRIIETIKGVLVRKIESVNPRDISDIEEILYEGINSELTKLKDLAYVYAESR